MVGSQKGSGTVRGPWTELARWRARRKSVGRNCVARRGKDSVGRVAADGKAGADYAGNSKGCGRGKELVGASSEAWAAVGWKIGSGGGRHEGGAAGNDIGGDFGSIVGGVNDVGSFGVVGDHAGHFGAGAQAGHAADGSAGAAGLDHARRWCGGGGCGGSRGRGRRRGQRWGRMVWRVVRQ